ncbi:cyclic GMP-AMP synthase-like receptor 2 isoform X2 [Ptychodera flava]
MFLKQVSYCFSTARRTLPQAQSRFKLYYQLRRDISTDNQLCLRRIKLFIRYSLSHISKTPSVEHLRSKYPLFDATNVGIEGIGSSFEGLASRKDRLFYGRPENSYQEIDANVKLRSVIAVDANAADDQGNSVLLRNGRLRENSSSGNVCLEMHSSDTPGFVDLKVPEIMIPTINPHDMVMKDFDNRTVAAKDVIDDFRLKCEYSALVHNRIARDQVAKSKQAEIYITTKFPAISVFTNFQADKTSQCDFAITIPVHGWPHVCREWINRTRVSEWPCERVVKKVVGKGCGLVPIPSINSVPSPEWRLSFGEAEGILSNHLSETQKNTFIFFKDVVQHYLTHPLFHGIKSYHLKNIFFWALEKTPRERWTEKYMDDRIKDLLNDLHSCLNEKMCPAYFIPKRNLFHKINDSVLMALSERLSALKEEKRKFQFRPLHKSHWELDIEFMTRVLEIQHKLQNSVHSNCFDRKQQTEAGKKLLRGSIESIANKWPYDWKPDDPVSSQTMKNEMKRILDRDFSNFLAQYRWRLQRIAFPPQYKYLDRYSIDMAVTHCFQNFHKFTLNLVKGNVDQMAPKSALDLLRR